MLLKNNHKGFFPFTEFVGVFITAAVIAVLHLNYYSRTNPMVGISAKGSAFALFLFVLGFYSIDHFLDLIRKKKAGLKFDFWQRSYAFVAFIASIGLLFQFSLEYLTNYRGLALAILSSTMYVWLGKKSNKISILFKPILIALSVDLAIHYDWINTWIQVGKIPLDKAFLFIVHFISFWLNVLAFGFFERTKDKISGEWTLFTSMEVKKGRLIVVLNIILSLVIYFIAIFWGFIYNGPFLYTVFIGIILTNPRVFGWKGMYRIFLDGFLLLLLL